MRVPAGFRFSGAHAGLKPSRLDVGLVVSDVACVAVGSFTTNRVRSAPVIDAAARLPRTDVRAVMIDSGNANALTGADGLADVRALREALGGALAIDADAVLTASTGVIGLRLPTAKVIAALPRLCASLSDEPDAFAQAILTTDTRTKLSSRTLVLDDREITVSIVGKGSGMIAPALATTIGVVLTDCAIAPAALSTSLKRAVEVTFNCLVIDGDMSTNDTVFALANGLAGNVVIAESGPELDRFTAALTEVCQELAEDIAADGEGATKLIRAQVSGAPSAPVARDLARAIVGSSLVKAAIFGADPNWGRILATLGARAGAHNYDVDPAGATVCIQGITVFARGLCAHDPAALRGKMRAPEVSIEVDLQGPSPQAPSHSARAWGCDLSYDYVKINADYTSLIVQNADGGVAKDDRLTNYSPAFKVALLVEALSYIAPLSGKRCVIKYGGDALQKESLKRSFCDDIKLLRSVGLVPVVVHGGGPELAQGAELKLVERATDAVNTELVTLLNRDGAHAVGVSGKDGALLRARRRPAESRQTHGHVGEVAGVNSDFLGLLLKQGYVPVISPVGIGDDGQGYQLDADEVAAAVAVAIGSSKVIYLGEQPGLTENGELVSELTTGELSVRLGEGRVPPALEARARAILGALAGGVERAHMIDGRTPHAMIAELFTDHGVGTLIRASHG